MVAVAEKFGIYAIRKRLIVSKLVLRAERLHILFGPSNRRDFLGSASWMMETFIGYRVLVQKFVNSWEI